MDDKRLLREYGKYVCLNVLGMIGLSCYILADTFFVSAGLGTAGLTALNLAIPVYSVVHGTGLMLGMGGAIRYSVVVSQGREEEGRRIFSHTLLLAAFFAILFLLLGIAASTGITRLLGADEEVFPMTNIYLQVILLFSPAFLGNDLLLCFVRNDGAPKLAMAAMVAGSLSNIVLDYLFIFPLRMGIFGAVLATGFAPLVSMALLSLHWIRGGSRLKPVPAAPDLRQTASTFSLGFPSFVGEISSGIVIAVFNGIILSLEGNTGVAAYGVIANLSLVVLAIYTGIAQGAQPLISTACGRGKRADARRVLGYALATMAVLSLAVYGAVYCSCGPIAAIFNREKDLAMQRLAEEGLRLYFTGIGFAGFNLILSTFFAAMERGLPAHLISLLRGIVVIVPAAFLLSAVWGMGGVWLSFPAAEGAVALVSLCLYRRAMRPGN